MSEAPKSGRGESAFSRSVGAREARRLHSRRRPARSVWFGFATFGLIGWSVAVPTLLGAGLGLWLDHRFPGRHSWTLALLSAGLVLGCALAWYWVAKEDREMRDEEEDGHD